MHPEAHHDPRLLAIDDSVLIHRLLKGRLRHERIEIHAATSGDQGLLLARQLLPDVILLDVEMPEMNGFHVLAQLKADPQTHDIPVIFLSSLASTTDKVRGLEMGALDFVTKPFEIAELKARIRSAVRLRLLIKLLAQRAQIDGMTGLWNRAYFDLRIEQEAANARRHDQPLSLIMCDIDEFKEINDSLGHPFGDRVIEQFGLMLADGRRGDIACRFGGDEFSMILPNTGADEAVAVADRLRRIFYGLQWDGHADLKVSASFGAADLASAAQPDAAGLIAAADQALYSAKQSGRNSVACAGGSGRSMKISA
jgi:diguanylate cyclase (GGDEF)-like protein